MTDVNVPTIAVDELTRILLGHAAFQYMRAGAELGLFDLLEQRPGLTRDEVGAALQLQDRPLNILLLGTTSLRLIERDGDGYRNSETITQVFRAGLWETIQAVIGFEAYITYPGLADFTESLRTNTNVGLRRVSGTGPTLYHRLAEDPSLGKAFYGFMHAWSTVASRYLVENVDFGPSRRVLDVGGGDGVMAIAVARAFPHVRLTILELPGTVPLTRKRVEEAGLGVRIDVVATDMFAEPFPSDHDTVMFVHQLQIWPLDRNTALLRSAHAALPGGGRVLIMSSMSEDSGDGPLMSALSSAFFAAVPGWGGMLYAWNKYEQCLREAGFGSIERIRCEGAWTPHGIILAAK